MTALDVADLYDATSLAAGRLSEALRHGAPAIWNWCTAARAPLRHAALLAHVSTCIAPALAVGLPACIVSRWLPRQVLPAFGPDLKVELLLTPRLDIVDGGLVANTLVLQARVQLLQAQAGWLRDAQGLQLGTPRAWLAQLQLALADQATPALSKYFYERRSTIYLPPGPWAC